MEQFNKALSFILGLVVVAVFIIVASGKFNIKGLNLKPTASKVTPTVTPTKTKPTVAYKGTTSNKPATPTAAPTINPNFHSYSGSNAPTSIPNTGVPIVMFPLLGTSFITGLFMKRTQKKND